MPLDHKPTASDIYERQAMDAENVGGSVQDDIAQFDNIDDMMDYFGDTDPAEFL